MGKTTKIKGRETLVNRDFYERLKKADRQEAEEMIWSIYDKGFAKGKKSGVQAFVEILKTAPGIGKVAFSKIQSVLQEWEGAGNE